MNYEPLYTFAEKHRVPYNELCTALRAALAAPQPEPLGYVSITGHGTYFRITITPELAALEQGGRKMWTPVVAAPPAAPAPAVPRHVRKIGGSFQHSGTVVAEFKTTAGEPRIVLEFDAPVAGMLHVYRPDQVEPCESAAPVVREPLTDEQIDALWSSPMSADWEHREFARAIEAHHGIGGGGNG